MKVLQKDLLDPKGQWEKSLTWPQEKVSIFVKSVSGSFWVLLFIFLPLLHSTLVNWVTCSLVFSTEMDAFPWRQCQWGQRSRGSMLSPWPRAQMGAVNTNPRWKLCPPDMPSSIPEQGGCTGWPPGSLPNTPTSWCCEYLMRQVWFGKVYLLFAEVSPPNTLKVPLAPIRGRAPWAGPCRAVPTTLLHLFLPLSSCFHFRAATDIMPHLKSRMKAKNCVFSQALNETSGLCNTYKALSWGTSNHQASVNQQHASPWGLWGWYKVILLSYTSHCWALLNNQRKISCVARNFWFSGYYFRCGNPAAECCSSG